MTGRSLIVGLLTALAWPAAGVAQAEEASSTASPTTEGEPTAAPEATGEATSEATEAPVSASVAEARERVGRGERLFEQGNYGAALVEFQQAYDVIGDHPSRYLILYNIGQCYERLFRYDQALRFYREYLEEGGDDAQGSDEVRASITSLQGLLATVHIEVNLPSAEVWVDERPVGTAPGSIRIPGGMHAIEVRAEGHLTQQREVSIPAGSEQALEFSLEQLPERFQGLHQAYFWSSLGLTVISLAVGVGLGVSAFQMHNDVDGRLDDDEQRWGVSQGEIDAIGDRAVAADVMFGVTAVFAIASVVFGLLTRWSDDEESSPRPTARLLLSPSVAGVTGGWRF